MEALLGFASGRVGSLNNMSVEPDAFVVMQTSLCLITHLMVHVLLACSAFSKTTLKCLLLVIGG